MLGSAGADSSQYVQPGGVYAGRGDTSFVLDRGQARVTSFHQPARFSGFAPSSDVGVYGSSSADVDYQRVDSRGLAYFTDRGGRLRARLGGIANDSIPLIRFDPSRQHGDTIALLRQHEQKIVSMDEHTQITSSVVGSPRRYWGAGSRWTRRHRSSGALPSRLVFAGRRADPRSRQSPHAPIPYTEAEKGRDIVGIELSKSVIERWHRDVARE